MKIIDFFAKNEIVLDYRWDKRAEDFRKTCFLGLLEDDEDRLADIIENVKEGISDCVDGISDLDNKAAAGQLISEVLDGKTVSEEEGLEIYNRFDAIYNGSDEEWESFVGQFQECVFEKEFEERAIEDAVRQYFKTAKEEGDGFIASNGIPLFAIGCIVMAIIGNALGEYEGLLHFDIGGGWLDENIPVFV